MLDSFFGDHPFTKKVISRMIMIIVTWFTIALCLGGTVFILGAMFGGAPEEDLETTYNVVYGDGQNELLSIPVNGTIVGTQDELDSLGFFDDSNQTAGYNVKQQLYAAADDDLIKGVVLEFNSPGGTIYGSRAIADGVKYYKEKTKKPVYAYVGGMAASGAYWAAASTDKIMADFGSDVGSIGVVMGPFEYYNTPLAQDDGLLGGGIVTQKGIESTTISAGKSKDFGNPYRKLTAEEVAALQKSVNNEYDSFVQYVSKQRNIPEATLRNTIGAMAYDNKTAQEYKLIDQTANRNDTYQALAKAADIEDDFYVVREEPAPSFVESLLTSALRKPEKQVKIGDACALTRVTLAYHGDVAAFCTKK